MKRRSSLRRFHKKDFFPMHLQFEYSQGCFYYQLPPFCIVVNILCSRAFSTIILLFFPGTFVYKIVLGTEEKSQEMKFLNGGTLFPETFFKY